MDSNSFRRGLVGPPPDLTPWPPLPRGEGESAMESCSNAIEWLMLLFGNRVYAMSIPSPFGLSMFHNFLAGHGACRGFMLSGWFYAGKSFQRRYLNR